MPPILLSFAQSLFSAFFLWFGLFIVTRRKSYLATQNNWWNDPTFFIGFLMVMASWQFFGVAMRSESLTSQNFLLWVKITWWVSPISVFFWCWSSFLIFKANTNKLLFLNGFKFILILFGILGIALAVFGTFTEWVFIFSEIKTSHSNLMSQYIFPSNWGAIVYISYQIILSFASLLLIFSAKKQVKDIHTLESALNLMLIGNIIAFIGITLIMVSGLFLDLLIPEQFGDFLLTLGSFLLAISVIQYSASIQKRIPNTDLWRSFGGVAIANLFYILFFELFFWRYSSNRAYHTAILPAMIFLTTLIHTPLEWEQTYLDRLIPKSLIPDWEKEYLKKTDRIRQEILTTPDPQITLENAEKELQKVALNARREELDRLISTEIEAIFRHKEFEKDQFLAQSKLFKLQTLSNEVFEYARNKKINVNSLTFLELAEIIRGFLTKMVSQLCPNPDQKPTPPLSVEWIEFIILEEKYINGKSLKEVEAIIRQYGYQPSGGAYSRHLQNGRNLLSRFIMQKELDYPAHQQEEKNHA